MQAAKGQALLRQQEWAILQLQQQLAQLSVERQHCVEKISSLDTQLQSSRFSRGSLHPEQEMAASYWFHERYQQKEALEQEKYRYDRTEASLQNQLRQARVQHKCLQNHLKTQQQQQRQQMLRQEEKQVEEWILMRDYS
ncbi:MAG: hypothetical protein JJT82_06050 [Legionellaceae bacterium]|nr:hypothetical protein [Legionellaceae bacterium]